MTETELRELVNQSRLDGRRLFGVSEFLYKAAIYTNWVIGIIGGIMGLWAITRGEGVTFVGIIIVIVTAAICLFNYMVAVLSTHIAKVLVHTSFASVGTLEYLNKKNTNNQKESRSTLGGGSVSVNENASTLNANCPNCGADIKIDSENCPTCDASFTGPSAWKPIRK
jgi:hypothetical protein